MGMAILNIDSQCVGVGDRFPDSPNQTHSRNERALKPKSFPHTPPRKSPQPNKEKPKDFPHHSPVAQSCQNKQDHNKRTARPDKYLVPTTTPTTSYPKEIGQVLVRPLPNKNHLQYKVRQNKLGRPIHSLVLHYSGLSLPGLRIPATHNQTQPEVVPAECDHKARCL